MRRGVLTALALLLTAVGLLWPVVPALFAGSGQPQPDPVTVTDYRADLRVDRSGTLYAEERVTATFPAGRHGIFRFWDVADTDDPAVRHLPEDIDVRLDGRPVQTELLWDGGARYRVAKIGDPDRYLTPGTHAYTIRYRIDGALTPAEEGAAFWWDVVAPGWQMSMDRTTVRVELPSPAESVECTCDVATGEDGRVLTLSTGALGPRTPVTVRATMGVDSPAQVTLPWPVELDAVLGRSVPAALLLLALATVTLLLGRWWDHRTRERPPGLPVMYEPPASLGPVQTVYVTTEHAPAEGLAATLLYQAERGLTRLEHLGGERWVIEGTGDPEAWAGTDPVTRQVGRELGVDVRGARFATDGSVGAGKRLQSTRSAIGPTARSWALETGVLSRVPWEVTGRTLVLVAAVVAAALFVLVRTWTLVGLPFAAFVVGGAGLLLPGVGTRRTPSGRELWSRAGGFRRLLATPAAEDRFDFSARRDLYTAYIPYAVAFGCADRWAEKYAAATGTPPPSPAWYPVAAGTGWDSGAPASFSSFEAALASSISAYEATQSSSSGGGGGGGGGSGGGGGGGSW
jgi:uncharacterized membrane protein YgcG